MSDRMTKQQRSYCMSRIRSTNTTPEKILASLLKRAQVKFSQHISNLPGKPDFLFREERIAVFVHGDFWHGWQFPKLRKRLKPGYWLEKITRNRKRDRQHCRRLKKLGWHVIRIWEHELLADPGKCITKILALLKEREHMVEVDGERTTYGSYVLRLCGIAISKPSSWTELS